jgi:diguanylate cyclase (GGDEF)-like protein/PAS domain S-box-containing protein
MKERLKGRAMPEQSIALCLDLCRQALSLEDEALTEVLGKLQIALTQMQKFQSPQLTEGRHLHADILDQIRETIITLDPVGYITGWNKGAENLFGYTSDEAIGQHILFLYVEDDNTSEVAELYFDAGDTIVEVMRQKKTGEIFWASLSLMMTKDDDGHCVGVSAHFSEKTDHLTDHDKLRLHARIIEDSDQGILITDESERIVSVNTAFTTITGYQAAEAMGHTPDLLRSGLHDEDFRAQVRAAMQGAGLWHGEILGRRKNGEIYPQSVSISVVRNEQGKVTHAFSIFSDISVHKEVESRMQRLANYDLLTGLPNSSLLTQLVEQALSVSRRDQSHGALLVIDLSRFTAINDTLGPEVGDALLCHVAEEFRHALREVDVLARIGASKFVVALLNLQKREHAAHVAVKLLASLESPIMVDSHELHVGANIGISVYPEDGLSATLLSRFAEIAMSHAQQSGDVNFLFYNADMNRCAKENLRLESELRRALLSNELQLYYQPKVSLRSGRIVGAEALLRWIHPEKGMISPGLFIPVAEETGLILDLGTWVLEQACTQIRLWLDAKLSMPPIAVNLSARQFDRNLPERIQEVLDRHQVAPEMLKLEITESLLVRGAENVIPIMNQLVAMGMALALDDFGTGYSSLAYLKRFPISTLKIDRSFVIGLPTEENDCAIAKAIVTMAQQLRQEIVAEGVETLDQMNFLRDLGCDQLQGFLFSPAVTAHGFEQMVVEGKRLTFT